MKSSYSFFWSLVVTDFLSCGWPIVETKFSEWVEIFVPGGTNFRGSKIKRDTPFQLFARLRIWQECTKTYCYFS